MATNPAPVEPAADPLETVSLKLSPETLNFLREEARKRGVTTGDMVRIALGTQKFLTEEVGKGAKVQLKSSRKTLDVKI